MKDKVKEVITIQSGNCTIRIHRPDISDEERERRLEEFKKATAVFMKYVYRKKGML